MLGPHKVCFISRDDKERLPTGITAATKQAPFLMHLEYQISLPDHDWVVTIGYKIVLSVYASIIVKDDDIRNTQAASYTGPTYITIHSEKHSSSTALSNVLDFQSVLEKPEFDVITKTHGGHNKPSLMLSVDGGPDENPRYNKVIKVAIQHFKHYDFDALLWLLMLQIAVRSIR